MYLFIYSLPWSNVTSWSIILVNLKKQNNNKFLKCVKENPVHIHGIITPIYNRELDTEGLKAKIEILFKKSGGFMKCNSCQMCNKYFCNSSLDLKWFWPDIPPSAFCWFFWILYLVLPLLVWQMLKCMTLLCIVYLAIMFSLGFFKNYFL